MPHKIPENLIEQLSELINAKTGLYFPKERWKELGQTVRNVSRDLSKKYKTDNDPVSFIKLLLSDPLTEKDMDALINNLTIGETYFFRDKNLFQVLEKNILPELIARHRSKEKSLKLWSAACCTGEEPYSLAILIDQLLQEWQEWHITFLATDLNAAFLQKAERGIYKEWSFRDIPEDIKKTYFEKKDEKSFEISPRLKKMVTFCQMNLSENNYPSKQNNTNDMDIIICRNVLMYFNPELRKQIVHRFTRSLSKDGWMILSPGDAIYARHPDLYPFRFPQLILYKKKKAFVGSSLKPEPTDPTLVGSSLKPEPTLLQHKQAEVQVGDLNQMSGYAPLTRPTVLNTASVKQPHIKSVPVNLPESSDLPGHSDVSSEKTVENLYQKAVILADKGELSEAEKYCNELISLEKLHVRCHYLLATVCQEQGRFRESVRSFKHALFLDPNFVLAHFSLGNLMHREGRNVEAKKYLSNAIKLLIPMDPKAVLPYSDGMTAGRLKAVIQEMLNKYE